MPKVIVGMTMSLDGYVSDREGSVEALYPDMQDLRNQEPLRESIRTTGAVVMGWKAFAMAGHPDWYRGNYEYQVPIMVVTRRVPSRHPAEGGGLTVTFVTDGLASAIGQAQNAAVERNVQVIGGARTARECLASGFADELHLDIMPVLLAGGLPLFDEAMGRMPLERVRVMESPTGRTHLRFRLVGGRAEAGSAAGSSGARRA